MVKRHTTLNIEDDLLKKARENLLNISEIAENALKDKLGKKEVEINEEINKCEFCDREMEKATPDNLEGLTWLYPDEKWICPKCLNLRSKSILK